jgi:hypothetical protein
MPLRGATVYSQKRLEPLPNMEDASPVIGKTFPIDAADLHINVPPSEGTSLLLGTIEHN